MNEPTESKKQRKRAQPHTRAIQRDRSKRSNSAPPDEQIEQWLEEAVHPAVYNQMALYRQLGLRERVLTLPVMVAFVMSLLWRQLGSVREGVRVLREEGMLWVTPLEQVTPQAMLHRLSQLPASLFYNVLIEVLPQLAARAAQRQRPLPPAVAFAQQYFAHIWAADGSVLDSLLKKCGLWQGREGPLLAGKIATLVDVATQVPTAIHYVEDSQTHDHSFWAWLMSYLQAGVLLLLDKGWIDFERFDELSDRQVGFITRPKSNTASQERRVLSKTATIHDVIIRLGRPQQPCRHEMRLVSVLFRGKWYRYLTNVLDPAILPAEVVVALYDQRWRIEEAFHTVKRLLGLAYFYTGSVNGLQLQVWATWLLYALLVDLTDSVAEGLHRPFRDLSLEMVFRGLYHFTQARHKGKAQDVISYFVRKAKDLALIKQKRPLKHLSLVEQMNLSIPKFA
jgi:hypothetical protein